MRILFIGPRGSGKTLAMSILGTWLAQVTLGRLFANYRVTGAIPED